MRIATSLTRLRGDRPVSWTTVLGLVLVPLTVAGVLLWGLWNPTERLEQITAAVVNNDEPVELDGQTVPLGRLLAGELIDGDAEENFTWVLTDEEDAEAGLDEGRYSAVVTIPESFSEAATSASSDITDPRTATIDIAESDRGRLLDGALSGIVTQTATTVLNQQLGGEFVGGVFVGMNELGSGIGDAATGASQLATGGAQLSDGASQLADGTQELADGTQELSSGANQVSSGASQLSGGLGTLSGGASQASDGASQVAGGVGELAVKAPELAGGAADIADGTQAVSDATRDLASGSGSLAQGIRHLADESDPLRQGASQLADGSASLATGADELAAGARTLAGGEDGSGVSGLATGVEQYTQGVSGVLAPALSSSGDLQAQLSQLVAQVQDGTIPTADEAQKQQVLDRIAETQSALSTASGQLTGFQQSGTDLAVGARQAATGADTLATGAEQLAAGADSAATGAREFSDGVTEYTVGVELLSGGADALAGGAGQLAERTPELAAGASQLAGGAGQLAERAPELAAGANQVAAGVSGLASGSSELSAGASELSTGASQLASGTSELAANTPELAEGASELADGAEQSADGASELSSGLSQAADEVPETTEAQRDKLAETALEPVRAEGGSDELFSGSGVPLFAGVALWAGALAVFLVLSPLWRRAREAARGVGYVALRSALPAVAIGAAQGAMAGVILPISLGYDFPQGAAFFGFALLVGVSFSLLVQGLAALLGGFGRFLAFVLLVIAFAVGIVSTVPGALAAIGDASPIGAAFSGFTAIASGISGGGAAALLVLWGLGGLLLTTLAARRARRAG